MRSFRQMEQCSERVSIVSAFHLYGDNGCSVGTYNGTTDFSTDANGKRSCLMSDVDDDIWWTDIAPLSMLAGIFELNS